LLKNIAVTVKPAIDANAIPNGDENEIVSVSVRPTAAKDWTVLNEAVAYLGF